ncbi:MAG: hydroxysqualene dehydroxylase HpnE [Bryobacteraceae bacterium]
MPDSAKQYHVAVVGGGLAGLATAVALGSAGYRVDLLESRPFLGGRATSYPINSADDNGPTIDNCQHILLRCCANLIDFYRRLGVENDIAFYRDLYWIEPGGRRSVLRSGMLPVPLHFAESFAALRFLSWPSKIAIGRAMLIIRSEYKHRQDLDRITMLDWLREKKQPRQAIDRFWQQVLVSAINEDLNRMAASHGLQVFAVGFLSRSDAYEMGVPNVPLAQLYSEEAWRNYPSIQIQQRQPVERIAVERGEVARIETRTGSIRAGAYVLAVPFERMPALAPDLDIDLSSFSHSPITGIHLWFDRPITDLPHATLLDRTIQWLFNKQGGRHIQLVVSASRSLLNMPRQQIIDLALRELAEFFPEVASAKLERAHVVKEVRATFSATPSLEEKRPGSSTSISNLFLAGDWTRSGWPATMEGAVRSGYLAAESVTRFFGQPKTFLLPDQPLT